MTNAELLEGLKEVGTKKEAVFRHLIDANQVYYRAIFKLVRNKGGDQNDFEDIFAKGLMIFFEKVRNHKFPVSAKENNIYNYLYTICDNVAINHLIKNRKEPPIGDTRFHSTKKPTLNPSAETTFLQKESQAEIIRLLGMIGENCKELLFQYKFFDYSHKELAIRFDRTKDGIKIAIHRCMKKWKALHQNNPTLLAYFND